MQGNLFFAKSSTAGRSTKLQASFELAGKRLRTAEQ